MKQKRPGMHAFQSERPWTQESIPAVTIFFHPDFTVGLGIAPSHAFRLAGCTAGGELHPALKTLIRFLPIIPPCQGNVNPLCGTDLMMPPEGAALASPADAGGRVLPIPAAPSRMLDMKDGRAQ